MLSIHNNKLQLCLLYIKSVVIRRTQNLISTLESAGWPSEKKRKRKSRWQNDEGDKTFIPGMPTTLPAEATDEQKEQYIRKYIEIGAEQLLLIAYSVCHKINIIIY